HRPARPGARSTRNAREDGRGPASVEYFGNIADIDTFLGDAQFVVADRNKNGTEHSDDRIEQALNDLADDLTKEHEDDADKADADTDDEQQQDDAEDAPPVSLGQLDAALQACHWSRTLDDRHGNDDPEDNIEEDEQYGIDERPEDRDEGQDDRDDHGPEK